LASEYVNHLHLTNEVFGGIGTEGSNERKNYCC